MNPQRSFSQWLDRQAGSIDAVLLDIDGVLLSRGNRLPGSRKLIHQLQRSETPLWLLTNDGNHSPAEKSYRLNRAGLPIPADKIISCGHALMPLVQSRNLIDHLFFAMGDTGSPCYAEAASLIVTREFEQLPHCHGIIIGEENYDWESTINAVINFFIDRPDAPLFIPNPDEFYPGPKLTLHVAAGGIGRFMQQVLKAYGISITPTYLGKPYAPIFDMALEKLKYQLKGRITPGRIVMVGDNLSADIAGGRAVGLTTALMLTGVTSSSALDQAVDDEQPDMVFEAL